MTGILVALAGGFGAVARYLVGTFAKSQFAAVWFVNLTGSAAFGFAAGAHSANAVLTAGFLGGFTTFSAAAAQSAELTVDGEFARGQAHAWAMAVLCVVAAVLMHTAATAIF